MLSESSYLTAIYTYIGAASALLLFLTWILSPHWRGAWVALTLLVCAALLFTPAYVAPNVSTMAPALIVAVFEGLINGQDAARHAIKPLVAMTGMAVVISIALRLTFFRRGRAS